MSFGYDFDIVIDHFDRSLIVDCVRRHGDVSGPFFGVSHGILEQINVIQVRKDREINDAKGFISSAWRHPPDEALPNAGSHDHASGAQPDVDPFP